MAEFREDVASWILAMPAAAALGFSFEELGGGRSVTRLRWRPEHSHAPGAFQASAVGALADFTGAGAAITLLPSGASAATMDYTVKFLVEARGKELVARGRVLRAGRTVTVAAVDIEVVGDGGPALCAAALVSTRAVP